MRSMKADPQVQVKRVLIRSGKRLIPLLILSPKNRVHNAPGVLWIHGGGYMTGMKEMVHMSRAVDLVTKFGAVVVSPGYRLSVFNPYPAAIRDCYSALLFMKKNASGLGFNKNQIMVGGESAGGGLTASLCMLARDKGKVNIAYQMPLYPMLDNFDTPSSADNHGRVWNTRLNHIGWKLYLRERAGMSVSPYAAAAGQTDFSNLPPAYTFVGDGEPFYCETLDFVEKLNQAGVEAYADVYPTDLHAFDMIKPELAISRQAAKEFNRRFAHAVTHYYAENE